MREIKKTIYPESNCKCNNKKVTLDLNFPITNSDTFRFLSLGYKENKSYASSGFFYIEGKDFIAIGVIGDRKLNINCKNDNCLSTLNTFEELLKK